MVVPQSKPSPSGKTLSTLDLDSSPEVSSNLSSNLSGNLDESTAVSSLKDLIAACDHRLDPMLATIIDAARKLTGASGAALAMWKDGAMVCRARSGDTAPALGAQLSAETGISGECLRTGRIQHCTDTESNPFVDVEVCRSLGLRSIAVLPIQGWRGINGILEVFSTQPAAFTEPHIALLQQLAALAERARASQPHGASSAAPKLPTLEKPQPSGLLPASDRVGDLALAFIGTRSRPFVLGAIGMVATSLLVLVVWLGWRGADEADGKAHAVTPASVNPTTAHTAAALPPDKLPPDKHLPDNDRVWKANPGGEPLFPSSGKTSAGTPVKFASKVDVVAGKKTQAGRSRANRSPLLADVAANLAVPHEVPNSQIGSHTDSPSDETTSADSPPILAGSASRSASDEALSAKASLPGLSAPVSQKVSGGQLVHRVEPVYPAQALLSRLEGRVILAAMVMEDGTLSDVKIVEGSPDLAPAAVDAVKHWRYKPFELDGKPVRNEIGISVEFKLPESLSH